MERRHYGIVIIGAGHAGGSAAAYLRQYGYDGTMALVGEEAHHPYQRPPLSKAWLKGEADFASCELRPAEFYQKSQIDFIPNAKVTEIDRQTKTLRIGDRALLGYDYCIIATGARALRPPIPGIDLEGVLSLRSADDAERLKRALHPGATLAVVGGGYIGLEAAASVVSLGAKVFVVEREERLLARASSPIVAEFFRERHAEKGVDVLFGAVVSEFTGADGQVAGVQFADGRHAPCDVVLVGVGARPNTELAEACEIDCDNGVVVDADARTSDPNIFAIGDVASRPLMNCAGRIRLESVSNALEQAKQTACAIVGKPRPKAEVTWNWSDQYDIKLQIAGVAENASRRILRGDPSTRSLSVFHLTERDTVVQVEAINAPGEFMTGKKLIASQQGVDAAQLADSALSVQLLLKQRA